MDLIRRSILQGVPIVLELEIIRSMQSIESINRTIAWLGAESFESDLQQPKSDPVIQLDLHSRSL